MNHNQYFVYQTEKELRAERKPLGENDIWITPEQISMEEEVKHFNIQSLTDKHKIRSIIKILIDNQEASKARSLPAGSEILIQSATHIPSPMSHIPQKMIGRNNLKNKLGGLWVYEGKAI